MIMGYARNGMPYFFTFLRNVNIWGMSNFVDKVLDKYGVFSACIFTFMCRESIIRYNETVKYL